MTGRIWFTSDTHFGHANVLTYCRRPFADLAAMHEGLIANWNAVVAPGDTVYHLGDFALGARAAVIPAVLPRLHGSLVLVAGNHDLARDDGLFPAVVRPGPLLLDLGGLRVECVHSPFEVRGVGDVALCGHVHHSWQSKRAGEWIDPYVARDHRDDGREAPVPIANVGVDVRGFRPCSIAELASAWS